MNDEQRKMRTPDTVAHMDIGKVVRYKSEVRKVQCRYAEAAERYESTGVLLAAPNNMPSRNKTSPTWSDRRALIRHDLPEIKVGMLLGVSTRQIGRIWYEEEAGGIFSAEGTIVVVMVQPLDNTRRYRQPVAVTEFEVVSDE